MKHIEKALENWRSMLIISPSANLEDDAVKRKIESIECAADRALNCFCREAKDSLFLGRMPQSTDDMKREYDRIYAMARSWGSFGTKHYRSAQILEILQYSLEWMYEHRYGQGEIDGCGWRDMKLFNWYEWEIACPELIINTLVILGDLYTAEDAKRFLKVFDFRVPAPKDYASNKIHYGKLIVGAGSCL